jgi:hypothetical protein
MCWAAVAPDARTHIWMSVADAMPGMATAEAVSASASRLE